MPQNPRPPQPSDVFMQGDKDIWRGANPWSGPYLVIAILVVGLLVVACFVIASLGLAG